MVTTNGAEQHLPTLTDGQQQNKDFYVYVDNQLKKRRKSYHQKSHSNTTEILQKSEEDTHRNNEQSYETASMFKINNHEMQPKHEAMGDRQSQSSMAMAGLPHQTEINQPVLTPQTNKAADKSKFKKRENQVTFLSEKRESLFNNKSPKERKERKKSPNLDLIEVKDLGARIKEQHSRETILSKFFRTHGNLSSERDGGQPLRSRQWNEESKMRESKLASVRNPSPKHKDRLPLERHHLLTFQDKGSKVDPHLDADGKALRKTITIQNQNTNNFAKMLIKNKHRNTNQQKRSRNAVNEPAERNTKLMQSLLSPASKKGRQANHFQQELTGKSLARQVASQNSKRSILLNSLELVRKLQRSTNRYSIVADQPTDSVLQNLRYSIQSSYESNNSSQSPQPRLEFEDGLNKDSPGRARPGTKPDLEKDESSYNIIVQTKQAPYKDETLQGATMSQENSPPESKGSLRQEATADKRNQMPLPREGDLNLVIQQRKLSTRRPRAAVPAEPSSSNESTSKRKIAEQPEEMEPAAIPSAPGIPKKIEIPFAQQLQSARTSSPNHESTVLKPSEQEYDPTHALVQPNQKMNIISSLQSFQASPNPPTEAASCPRTIHVHPDWHTLPLEGLPQEGTEVLNETSQQLMSSSIVRPERKQEEPVLSGSADASLSHTLDERVAAKIAEPT